MTTEPEAGAHASPEVGREAQSLRAGTFLERVRRRLRVIDRHVAAALIMVMISIFGAIAAYEAALAEQTSAGLERRLAAAQLQDIGFRQNFYSEIMYRVGLESKTTDLRQEAEDLRAEAASLPHRDARVFSWLEWHAAELHTQEDALIGYTNDLASFNAEGRAGDIAAAQSVKALRTDGFGAAAAKDVVSFPLLEKAVARAHQSAPWLALCVLLFVAGLVCFTVAELELGPPRSWWLLAGAGLAFAVAGAIGASLVDPLLWLVSPLAAALGAAVAFAVRSELFPRSSGAGRLLHPEAPEPAHVPLAYLAGHAGNAGHDKWSRNIVVLISIAVFFSAVFGWGYSAAVKEAGEASLLAQEAKTRFVAHQGTLIAGVTGGAFDSMIRLQAARTHCAAATQLSAIVLDGEIPVERERADQEKALACKRLETVFDPATREDVSSHMDANDRADSAAAPARAVRDEIMDQEGGPNELLAEADAKSALSANWTDRSTRLLAVLTVLAIVLFLLGQAHSMGATASGRLIRTAAFGLLVISLALGAVAYFGGDSISAARKLGACTGGLKLSTPEDVARLGAKKFAEGLAARRLGEDSPPGSPERDAADAQAGPALKCATQLLPDFLPAYDRYMQWMETVGSPQRDESWVSLANRARLKEIYQTNLASLVAANRGGFLRSSARLSGFAFDATRYALVAGDRHALAEGRIALDALVHRDDAWRTSFERWRRPELFTDDDAASFDPDWFNLGLLELATGEPGLIKQAQDHYDLALKTPQSDIDGHVASALVDLEILTSYCPRLYGAGDACRRIAAAVGAIKGRIANLATQSEEPKTTSASVQGFKIEVTPSSVGWSADVRNFDSKRDRLSVVWYRDDSGGDLLDANAWHLRRALESLMEVYGAGGDMLPKADNQNITHDDVDVVFKTSDCLGAGRYGAELILNGAVVGTASLSLEEDLTVVRTRELDLVGCVPKTWGRFRGKDQAWSADAPGRTFVSNSNGKAKFETTIATFYAPSGMSEEARRSYFLHRTVQLILGKGRPDSQWTQEAETGYVNQAERLGDDEASCDAASHAGGLVYRFIKDPREKNVVHMAVGSGLEGKAICPILKSFANYYH